MILRLLNSHDYERWPQDVPHPEPAPDGEYCPFSTGSGCAHSLTLHVVFRSVLSRLQKWVATPILDSALDAQLLTILVLLIFYLDSIGMFAHSEPALLVFTNFNSCRWCQDAGRSHCPCVTCRLHFGCVCCSPPASHSYGFGPREPSLQSSRRRVRCRHGVATWCNSPNGYCVGGRTRCTWCGASQLYVLQVCPHQYPHPSVQSARAKQKPLPRAAPATSCASGPSNRSALSVGSVWSSVVPSVISVSSKCSRKCNDTSTFPIFSPAHFKLIASLSVVVPRQQEET